MLDAPWRTALCRKLLRWFDQNQRELPWRKRKTRYRIWVSEIMLQQTQVATVIDYFNRFIKQFPNVKELASADESEVLKLWEGLGYYRRARQMHAAAKMIVAENGGRFPSEFESVLALPGIGRYTAGAILSIADDQPLPILEGNTIRLLARLVEMKSDPRKAANQKELWSFSESLLPRKRCGDFNQALMELGSTLCHPRNPNCDACPIRDLCVASIKGLQSEIPAPSRKIQYEKINEAVLLVKRGNRYLVRQCGSGERWEGLWDFPRYEKRSGDGPTELARMLRQQTGLVVELRPFGKPIKHTVTRFRIQLDCFQSGTPKGRIKNSATSIRWMTLEQINGSPMSATGRLIAKRL